MKSVLSLRLSFAVLLLSVLIPSIGRSQTHTQLNAVYRALQQHILKEHPTAIFPAIPYEKYDSLSNATEEGTVDWVMKPTGDFYTECQLIFPEFESWDIYSEEMGGDLLAGIYVMATFFLVDPETNELHIGRGSKSIWRMENKTGNSPSDYEILDPDFTAVFTDPKPIESWECASLHTCMPKEDPIYKLLPADCPE